MQNSNMVGETTTSLTLVVFKVLLLMSVTHGQDTCDTCVNDTEFTPCNTTDVVPCNIVGNNYICVPGAPRDTLCQSPPPTCLQEGKFLFPEYLNDCDRYYECDSSLVAATKFCMNGQLFSVTKQECVPAAESDCKTGITNVATTEQQTVNSEQSSSVTNSPTPQVNSISPTSGTTVTQGVLISSSPTQTTPDQSTREETATPATETTLIASSTTESILNSTDVTTGLPTEDCMGFGRLPDPTSCNRFYICVWRPFQGFKKVLRRCPFRLVYDVTKHICRFNTSCGERPRTYTKSIIFS